MDKFTHLHLHTKYSLQDGTTEPEALMKKCADYGMTSVGVTDHGNMAGMYDCFKYADKYGINLIPGNEFYVVPDVHKSRGRDWMRGKSAHLGLLAFDNRGWQNLLLLTAKSNLIGHHYEPRIDYKMLREHSEGLWCMTGCLGGLLGKALRRGESASLALDMLYDIFGDRLSLEIQVNGIPEQSTLNDTCLSLHKAKGIPLVATIDAHYLDKKDSYNQDVLFAIQLGHKLSDEDRLKMPEEEHSVETPEEALLKFQKAYGKVGLEACKRTVEIAENSKIDFTYSSRNYKIPTFDILAQADWQEFMLWKSGCECHKTEDTCLVHGKDCSH